MVVIFKPTTRCNIKCLHCYVGDTRHLYKDMSVEDARKCFEKLPPQTEVIFHGGEPTLMGQEFFRKVTDGFKEKLSFSIQTNLTLIDESWVPILHDILDRRISTSFDYKESLRPIDPQKWINTVRMLQKNNVNPYVVSIFWKGNQNVPAHEFLNFFEQLETSFRLNAVENIGYASDNGFSSLRHDGIAYSETLKKIFDLWFMNPKTNIIVDPCAEILSFFLVGGSIKKCPFTSKCYCHIMSINPNGDVFPCGGFDCFPGFKYGNLLKQGYNDLFHSQIYLEAADRLRSLPEKCQACDYLFICEGGCRLEAYSFYGSIYRETSLCNDYKNLFQHIEKRIESEKGDINDWWMSLLSKRQGGYTCEYISKSNQQM